MTTNYIIWGIDTFVTMIIFVGFFFVKRFIVKKRKQTDQKMEEDKQAYLDHKKNL